MVDTIVIYSAFFSELWQEKIAILVPGAYCKANTLCGKAGLRQNIRQRQGMLDAIVIYRILYANSIAATLFLHRKISLPTFYLLLSGPVLLPRTGEENDDKESLTRSSFLTHSLVKAEAGREHRDCDRFPQSGIDRNFRPRSLPLSKYISRKIWIVSDYTATTDKACLTRSSFIAFHTRI